MKYVQNVVSLLIKTRARRAIKYISPKEIIRATRVRERGKIAKNGTVTIVLTVGRPNSIEAKFVKNCVKAGEPFPVRNIQLKFPKK